MKKMIFFSTVSLFTLSSFSQTLNPTLTKDDYLQKSKKQKTTGWILFIGGTTMAVIGGLVFSDNFDYGSDAETDASGYLVLGGVFVDLLSIPFFISSSKNARKAASISLETQKLSPLEYNNTIPKQQMALTLRIGL